MHTEVRLVLVKKDCVHILISHLNSGKISWIFRLWKRLPTEAVHTNEPNRRSLCPRDLQLFAYR